MEASAGEEAQGEEEPAAAPLDVSRLRSSSMEIREKGSEFLKEELHKAQKVGTSERRSQPGKAQRHGDTVSDTASCKLGQCRHLRAAKEEPIFVSFFF